MAGDGQVTLNNTVIKHNARKVRRIYNETILVGFAGATADALTLTEKLEQKLERYNGILTRSAVELARDWRADKYLRRLEALMIAVDKRSMLLISGNGDVIEPDEGIVAIGSGRCGRPGRRHGPVPADRTGMPARAWETAMTIASSLCVFTNDRITIEEL